MDPVAQILTFIVSGFGAVVSLMMQNRYTAALFMAPIVMFILGLVLSLFSARDGGDDK